MEIEESEPASVLLERETRIFALPDPCAKEAVDFLDQLKQVYCLTSDYQLSDLLSLSKSAISNYRRHLTAFDEDVSIKVATLLRRRGVKVTDGYVLACMAHDRSRSRVAREAWRQVAKTLHAAARPQP